MSAPEIIRALNLSRGERRCYSAKITVDNVGFAPGLVMLGVRTQDGTNVSDVALEAHEARALARALLDAAAEAEAIAARDGASFDHLPPVSGRGRAK